MTVSAISCSACGGAIAHRAGEALPRCLFCGSEALEPVGKLEVETPELWLGFELEEAGAIEAFQAWTRSSIWYPSDLRNAQIVLHRLMLPAWIWKGRLETHWAALVPAASTRSGKRPRSGETQMDFDGVLVPSSTALSRSELADICPFELKKMREIIVEDPGLTYELGGLTRRAACRDAVAQMRQMHSRTISDEIGAVKIHVSALDHDLSGRPLLLPVYIGAFRRKEKIYRVVINGQTAALTGSAPLSGIKILSAIVGVIALVMVLFFLLTT